MDGDVAVTGREKPVVSGLGGGWGLGMGGKRAGLRVLSESGHRACGEREVWAGAAVVGVGGVHGAEPERLGEGGQGRVLGALTSRRSQQRRLGNKPLARLSGPRDRASWKLWQRVSRQEWAAPPSTRGRTGGLRPGKPLGWAAGLFRAVSVAWEWGRGEWPAGGTVFPTRQLTDSSTKPRAGGCSDEEAVVEARRGRGCRR